MNTSRGTQVQVKGKTFNHLHGVNERNYNGVWSHKVHDFMVYGENSTFVKIALINCIGQLLIDINGICVCG